VTQYEQQVTHYEQQISQFESELSLVRQDNQKLKGSLDEYEKRIVMLSMEMERLNSVLKKGSPSKQDANDLKRLAEYENKLAILNQELERLNDTLRIKDNKLKNAETESEQLRRRVEEGAQGFS
jgi:uncharacterized small protein (DUF1192 family)